MLKPGLESSENNTVLYLDTIVYMYVDIYSMCYFAAVRIQESILCEQILKSIPM